MNQSMKSTLNVGSDTVLRSSLQLRDASNASPIKHSKSDDASSRSSLDNVVVENGESPQQDLKEVLGINKEAAFPIKKLYSADL